MIFNTFEGNIFIHRNAYERFNSYFYELTKIVGVAGKTEKVACEVYSGVKTYATRTQITLPKPVTTENTKFRSKFRKKRKS